MPVTVKLVNNNRWAGLIKYPERYYDICPYMKKNRTLYTGFDESDEKDRAELKKFEKSLHTELNNASEFWETFFIRLTADDLILDPGEYDYDALRLRWLRNHKDAQLSPRKPKANAIFIIVDEVEEAKATNDRSRIKTQAFSELNKMTTDEKRDCLRLYGYNYDNVSNEVVEARMFELVDDNAARYVRTWVDDTIKYTKVLVERALSKGVLTKKGKSIYFGGTPLGSNVEEAALELEKDTNVATKAGVKKGLEEGTKK